MKKILFSLFLGSLFFCACSKNEDSVAVTPISQPTVVQDTILYKMLPFQIGASVSVNLMKNNTKYSGIVTKEFSSITAENAMKFGGLHSSETNFNFTDSDYLVSYAQQNNKRVHGHTLVWYTSLPTWVTNFQGDSLAWENLLKTHIQTVVSHFKGKVVSWDVVNEDFEDTGIQRNSIWKKHLGGDYVARCFQYAHEADPDALLFYNDYGHEYSSAKREAITKMLADFKKRGIPVHGIGMQFHMTHTQSDANIVAAITSAAATGLKVHISELDIRVNNDKNKNIVFTSALAQLQASRYKFVVKTYNSIPINQQFGITTWNVTDADSWIPNWLGAPDFPLPFDANYLRKPAYKGIIEGVK